ncbi:hypothetical protein QJS04_geneDACA014968 [Acorus gramineus]|uniref:Uncharacterized protein n=1 Tax=Acorus gramineus TaxID=55184 RepID=A0AAV9AKA8_ACOGR|nr:hypothetical protein QJS04_geneDACA014968 [Acorus gramineus]
MGKMFRENPRIGRNKWRRWWSERLLTSSVNYLSEDHYEELCLEPGKMKWKRTRRRG